MPARTKLSLRLDGEKSFEPQDTISGCVTANCDPTIMPDTVKVKLIGTCTRVGTRETTNSGHWNHDNKDNHSHLRDRESFEETFEFIRVLEIVEPRISEKVGSEGLHEDGTIDKVWDFNIEIPSDLRNSSIDEWKDQPLPPSLSITGTATRISYKVHTSPNNGAKYLGLINKVASDSVGIEIRPPKIDDNLPAQQKQSEVKYSVPLFDKRALTWTGWAQMLIGVDISVSEEEFVLRVEAPDRRLRPGAYLQDIFKMSISKQELSSIQDHEFETRCKKVRLKSIISTRAKTGDPVNFTTRSYLYRADKNAVDDWIPLDAKDGMTDVTCLMSGLALPRDLPRSIQLVGLSIHHSLEWVLVVRPQNPYPYRKEITVRIEQEFVVQ